MSSSLSTLSASVTRILFLTGFPKELKTKDIQAAFSEYENMNGGFKIKWRDDTSLLIVFQDPTTAKRAYLHTIAFPPPVLTSSSGVPATIRPYDGADAQAVIQAVNSRGQHHPNNPSRSHGARSASISAFNGGRSSSGSVSNYRNNQPNNNTISIPELSAGREPSPTLPSLPSHPTLNSLISSSLGDVIGGGSTMPLLDPAIVATSLSHDAGAPRIGDPGKRMLGAALGVRHPGLGVRMTNGNSPPQRVNDPAIRDMQRVMGGLVVGE